MDTRAFLLILIYFHLPNQIKINQRPLHEGFTGLLDAAVLGNFFTSPSPLSILAAILSVPNKRGVLLIVKNYTGDRVCFQIASEMARKKGIESEIVIVADDVSLKEEGKHAGRRGIAGTVLVHKIVGSASKMRKQFSLVELKELAQQVSSTVKTISVCTSSCVLPFEGSHGFSLKENEVWIGVGIHGEVGVRKKKIEGADQVIEEMLESYLLPEIIDSGTKKVAVLINNLGSTTNPEMSVCARKVRIL